MREALQHAKRVVVIEKCLAVGLGGIVSDGVRKALSGHPCSGLHGDRGTGRPRHHESLADAQLFEEAERDELEQVTFLDLDGDIVNRELERESRTRRSGPTAEAILQRLGTVASQHR